MISPLPRDSAPRGTSPRIAVFGGTFDPVHLGHVTIADTILAQGLADRVLVIPAWRSPLKPLPHANLAHRFRMLEIAFGGRGNIEISDLEAWPVSESPVPCCPSLTAPCSFTVDTLKAIAAQWTRSGDSVPELSLVVGEDSLGTLDKWRGLDEILSLASLIVVPRPAPLPKGQIVDPRNGDPRNGDPRNGDPRTRSTHGDPRTGDPRTGDSRNGDPRCTWKTLRMDPVAASSTAVRALTRRTDLAASTGEGVAGYIIDHNLYSFRNLGLLELSDRALELSISLTSKKRGLHCLGTGMEAERLAVLYGADPVKARIAGFLHDAARDIFQEEGEALFEKARLSSAPPFPGMAAADWPRPVAHGPAGAALAADRLGITDPDILEAIAWHAVGKEAMSPLAACVYIADLIETTRNFPGVDSLRTLASLSDDRIPLNELLETVFQRKIGHLAAAGKAAAGGGRIFLAGTP